MPQLYKKPWNNTEAKKRNPQHEDMFNLHVAATPAGRTAVESFAKVCVDLEGAVMQEGTAPPIAQERSIQEALSKMSRQWCSALGETP